MSAFYQPVIILGAARSGTNVLRDVLTSLPGFATWPCDEINPVWRHGNLDAPDDELAPERATPPVRAFIRCAFERRARATGARFVVEKTCANCLRVGFVDRVLTEARYLVLLRDGRDVTASAMRRWTAPADLAYTLRKARWVPPGDLPHYALRWLGNRLHRLRSGEKRLATWGPRFRGMDEALASRSLAEVCALQWKRSVERAEEDLGGVDAGRVFRLRYEGFVKAPAETLGRILAFLGESAPLETLERAVAAVSTGSVGQGAAQLGDELPAVETLIGDLLARAPSPEAAP